MILEDQIEVFVRVLVKTADVVDVDLGARVWFENSRLRLAHGTICEMDFL